MTDDELTALATQVGERLRPLRLRLVTAESCTGGWVAKVATGVPGSSAWFDRGFVTYSNASKQDMLGVSAGTLEVHGAVSEATVREMAEGALAASGADLAVAISGIAGPGGGIPARPVGSVWLAWAVRGEDTRAEFRRFEGERDGVRRQAVGVALQGILDSIHG